MGSNKLYNGDDERSKIIGSLFSLNTEVLGSTGFWNNGFSGIRDISAIPKLKFCIKNAQSNRFPKITDKVAIPKWSVPSKNLCRSFFAVFYFPIFSNVLGYHWFGGRFKAHIGVNPPMYPFLEEKVRPRKFMMGYSPLSLPLCPLYQVSLWYADDVVNRVQNATWSEINSTLLLHPNRN